jgi:hypothetical protein
MQAIQHITVHYSQIQYSTIQYNILHYHITSTMSSDTQREYDLLYDVTHPHSSASYRQTQDDTGIDPSQSIADIIVQCAHTNHKFKCIQSKYFEHTHIKSVIVDCTKRPLKHFDRLICDRLDRLFKARPHLKDHPYVPPRYPTLTRFKYDTEQQALFTSTDNCKVWSKIV